MNNNLAITFSIAALWLQISASTQFAGASDLPKIDVGSGCEAYAKTSGGDVAVVKDNCVRKNTEAKDTLSQSWGAIGEALQNKCSALRVPTPYPYTRILSCIDEDKSYHTLHPTAQ